jgi:hypothetical protein
MFVPRKKIWFYPFLDKKWVTFLQILLKFLVESCKLRFFIIKGTTIRSINLLGSSALPLPHQQTQKGYFWSVPTLRSVDVSLDFTVCYILYYVIYYLIFIIVTVTIWRFNIIIQLFTFPSVISCQSANLGWFRCSPSESTE